MSALKELLDRVNAATGPDDDLDADIWLAVVPGASRKNLLADYPDDAPSWEYHDAERSNYFRSALLPHLTGSVDAALDLVERVLPGAMRRANDAEDGDGAKADLVLDGGHHIVAEGATWPLAILSALLSALIARDGQ